MTIDKPLTSITEADLLALIELRVGEQKTIDYKIALKLDSQEAKDEFRKDVTSFANASGGDYIVGMQEKNSYPTTLCGQEIKNIDAWKQSIDAVLQAKISPRVPSYGVHAISLSSDSEKYAVVIRIGRSFVKPHQITTNEGCFQFWARNSAGKYRLSIDELRNIILRSDAVADQVRRFRMERIANVVADDTPVPIQEGARIVLHMVPLCAFDLGVRYDLSKMKEKEWEPFTGTLVDDEGRGSNDKRHNLDGFVGYCSKNDGEPNLSYSQIFRNGIIEAVDALCMRPRGQETIPYWYPTTEKAVYTFLNRGLGLQEKLGISPPIAVMLSVVGCTNVKIYIDPHDPRSRLPTTCAFGKDVITLNEEIIDDFGTDLDIVMKPILDAIWNAGGYESCGNFDANGTKPGMLCKLSE